MADDSADTCPGGEAQPQPGPAPPDGAKTGAATTAWTASAPVTSDTADETDGSTPLPFDVVGIGASAGGVEAYIEFFEHIPADTGMAYVVVIHLSADQKSHLREILARHTEMPVLEIENGMRVEPDRIYVVPSNALLRLEKGIFQLEPPDAAKRAIDHFFFSLAAEQKNRAIGVIFSGMDSDGALGMRAIKGEGGITMVQAPESARYPDMPRSSISVDHVDIISTPSIIATQLEKLSRQVRQTNLRLLQEGQQVAGEEQQFLRILSLMRGVSGVDFRLYKPSTIRRRIARRMLLHHMDTLREYMAFLNAHPQELRELHEDALIGVTSFFRDPEVFEALKNFLLPRLFENRDPTQQVRFWVAGCSSGEEVYSLAICLLEYLAGSSSEPPIQIFGTDASEMNIQKARLGVYPETISADVSPERLRRFFVKTEKGYQVSKRIRDLCIFARQNLCHDPPFSRLDVISCRNVLIYFGSELQRQLIPTFHYALRPDGYLILGTTETIREFTDLFSLADRKHKIYAPVKGASVQTFADLVPRRVASEAPPMPQTYPPENWSEVELQRAADRILLARFGPPCLVVNARLEILQSRGHVSPFLELRPGAVSFDLLRIVRDSIAPQVTAAVRRSIEHEQPVQVEGLQVTDGDSAQEVTLEVLPIQSVVHRPKCYLVVFAPPRSHVASSAIDISPAAPVEEKDRLIAQLQQDLSSTKLYLHSLIEERDAKNQELLSANEEIQSANEELQSTNEELETTKEELQSSNEELHTVNDELQNRNAILSQTSNDLLNLLNSVNLPVVMLSNEFTIRHFTSSTQRIMNIRSSDVGRPFSELRLNLKIEDLTPLFSEVLSTLTPREMEVQDRDDHWYLLRVWPYRTADNKIEGLVVALVDIEEHRRAQQELRAARDLARSIIEGVPLPLAVVDREFRIRTINQAFCSLTGLEAPDLEYRFLPVMASRLWGLNDALGEQLEKLRNSRNPGESFEFEHTSTSEPARTLCVRGCVLHPDTEHFLLITMEDMTARAEAERLLKVEKERLTREVETTTQALSRSQEELRRLAANLFSSQEDERRRIARELHDDISQRLASLEIDSARLEQNLAAGAETAKGGLQSLRERLAQLSQDVRLMSHRLHPSVIEDLGLKAALRALAEEFAQREDMIATFSSENIPDELPLESATSLYRIAQEALRNVGKHAGKTHTRVSLKGTPEGLQLQVADFGNGFDMESVHHGLGLVSMEERARQIGGTFQIQSRLGEGTRVTVNVPWAALQQFSKSLSHAG